MPDSTVSVKDRVSTVAKHVYHYRGRYAAGATLVATVALFNKMDRVKQWNEFLQEKGLYDEFYNPGE